MVRIIAVGQDNDGKMMENLGPHLGARPVRFSDISVREFQDTLPIRVEEGISPKHRFHRWRFVRV